MGDFLFGLALGFLLGHKLTAMIDKHHLERMKKIWRSNL